MSAPIPFDAVLLFGLHNDEIPMRHWGDADVIDLWNREYAYPKVIPATATRLLPSHHSEIRRPDQDVSGRRRRLLGR